jgi:hypothetical protein
VHFYNYREKTVPEQSQWSGNFLLEPELKFFGPAPGILIHLKSYIEP